MKRTSLVAAVLAAGLPLVFSNPAHAVNPQPGQTFPNQQLPGQYNPGTLPGQDYLGQNYNYGVQNDPFFTPDAFSVYPISPGLNNNNQTVPNPPNYNAPAGSGRNRLPQGVQPSYVAPGQNPAQGGAKKWRLGVYSKDHDTGVRIHDVVAGGAAARAGLEVNDHIIAVNGFQVGYVNGQLYDCGTEFERLADQNGWVNLLVQNNRNSQLINVPVQLDSRLSTLRGSIALQNRQNLPTNAVVNVELKEIIGNARNPVTFASTQINQVSSYPIPFAIDFDPAQISPNGRYVVYASVLQNGREIYRTNQTPRVLDQGGQLRPVALQLDQVSTGSAYPQYPNPNGGTVLYDQSTQVAKIIDWYRQYLGRDPSDRELVAWLDNIKSGQSISQVQLALLANDQFFNNCNQNERLYIERLHQHLVGRNPTNEEMAYWLSRYNAQNGIRRDFAREFQGAVGVH